MLVCLITIKHGQYGPVGGSHIILNIQIQTYKVIDINIKVGSDRFNFIGCNN